ncbi:hypothetical protein L873DRAFT_1698443, partial [Choiromyces venosus 120613-1]
EKILNQIISQVIPVFNLSFLGCQALFLFNNFKIHDSLPPNTLQTYYMNSNPGGEAPIICDT